MSDLAYYVGFSHFLGIGPIRFFLLKKHFGSAKKAYLADKKELDKVIGTTLTDKFIDFRNKFDLVKKLEELKKKQIIVLTIDDENYPYTLKNINDPPICLYIKSSTSFFSTATPRLSGPLAKVSKTKSSLVFGIVGTRNPTSYGIQVTQKFSYELASAGFTIVSGMAYGIDTIAHKSCLDAGGKTVAVLGCGVDVVYPYSNKYLYDRIIETGGAVISEFPPGQFVLKGLFVARNRIISALSQGVMIVEGTKDSGSLITAKYAAEQGKEVFAPPNPITSTMSAAPNILLKQGAKLVTSIEDILEEFNMKMTPRKKEDIIEKLNEEEKEIFILLSERPMLIDDLTIIIKKPIYQILNTLSVMEIGGIIEKNNENLYQTKLR